MSGLRRFAAGAVFLALSAAPAGAGSPFDRLVDDWQSIHDYSVTIDAHEVLGDQTDQHELHYSFVKPDHARLDVISGSKSGSTIVWNGGDSVVAYRRSMSFLKMHGSPTQKDLTSLRGNGVLSPNMGDLVACFGEHRESLEVRDGPLVDGDPTDEIALPYKDVACPDDPPADRGAVTLDVLDVSRKTGMIVQRTRFAGDVQVERWALKDYVIDSGLTDSDIR